MRSASITYRIRHYVARRAQVIEDHPHNAAFRAPCVADQLTNDRRASTDGGQTCLLDTKSPRARANKPRRAQSPELQSSPFFA